jgi:hypothetical protein
MNVLKLVAVPRKLLASFVLSAGVLLMAIGWLGWRLLAQERVLDDQPLHDQLENSASLATRCRSRGYCRRLRRRALCSRTLNHLN